MRGTDFVGTGTRFVGDACSVDDAIVCGPGTAWSGSQCKGSTPLPSLAAFNARPNHTTSFFDTDANSSSITTRRYRFIATDLTQGTADGWTELLAPPVGSGAAVHLKWTHYSSTDVSTTPQTIRVEDASSPGGKCRSDLTPGSEPPAYDGTYVTFFGWNATAPTALGCSLGGTVTFVREPGTPDRIKLTFNVQFNDGSAWLNRVFLVEYRKDR